MRACLKPNNKWQSCLVGDQKTLSQVPFWYWLFTSVLVDVASQSRASNLCVGAWLLVNNSQWLTPISHCLKLQFLVPSNVLLSSLLVCYPNCVVSLSLSSCFGILRLLFQLYEWLHTFVLWISLLQILKDFNVPKRSCYRFHPTIWCTIWHADGTDETTLQAVNVNT